MEIIINEALTRTYTDERGSRRVVYFTLTDNNNIEYRMLDDLPGDVNPQAYLDAHIEEECLFVRQEEYKQKPLLGSSEGQTKHEAFETWVADGCKIQVGIDPDGNPIYQTSTKRTWRERW